MPHASPGWTPIPNDVSLLPALRALYECQAEVNRVTSRHLDTLGLTPARFEVLSALGDTDGMTVKELADQSLTTKGNLLHVLGHLEDQGLVRREKCKPDSRQTHVSLTPEGQAFYEKTFMVHVDAMRAYFDQLSPNEQQTLTALLAKLKRVFTGTTP
ncbi:Transcriptional regulator HosA [compost metagenome]